MGIDLIVFEDTVATCIDDYGVAHQGVWQPGATNLVRRCDGVRVMGRDVIKHKQMTTCLLCLSQDRSSKRFEIYIELEE